ncbi:MAG: MaoC family dehydratase N-terminal domain-containing protein [Pseudomonadota bacterium]
MSTAGWIGKSETRTDPMNPWPSRAFCRTLELARPEPGEGDPLPAFWHWMHFPDVRPRSELGPDGHPAVGGFIPKVAQPRRMWAGGRLQVHRPLPLGLPAARVSTIANVAEKTGKAGAMTFVTVRHEVTGAAGLALTEEQDIVYREDPDPGVPKPAPRMAATDETHTREWMCDTTVLFRYSALTFNGHKIHYDLRHATEVEGYSGLVVHGPLLAKLLLELAHEIGAVSEFSYRLTAPVFADEPFTVCAREQGDGLALWVRGADGRLAIEGQSL